MYCKETKKKQQAVEAFLQTHVFEPCGVEFEISLIPDNNPRFSIYFDDKTFNDIEIRVKKLWDDDEELEYSYFEIHIHEDMYEDFTIGDENLCEFWKACLWMDEKNIK